MPDGSWHTFVLRCSEVWCEERIDARTTHVPGGSPQAVADVGSWERVLGIVVPMATCHRCFPIPKYRSFDSPKMGEVAVLTAVSGW